MWFGFLPTCIPCCCNSFGYQYCQLTSACRTQDKITMLIKEPWRAACTELHRKQGVTYKRLNSKAQTTYKASHSCCFIAYPPKCSLTAVFLTVFFQQHRSIYFHIFYSKLHLQPVAMQCQGSLDYQGTRMQLPVSLLNGLSVTALNNCINISRMHLWNDLEQKPSAVESLQMQNHAS